MTPDEIKQRLADAGLMVKPLVWEYDRADTLFGIYSIEDYDSGSLSNLLWFYGGMSSKQLIGGDNTVSGHQAAAQADCERRIYEALMEGEE